MTDSPLPEKGTSGTALGTAFLRALAAHDPRPERRGPDDLAEIFLDDAQRRAVGDAALRASAMANQLSPGAYEFMVARTAFFDGLVAQALRDGVPQAVWLGAGYDSRPYRFRHLLRGTRVFELDAAPTQQRKQACLSRAGIPVPDLVRFVPIDFESDDLGQTLRAAGFDSGQQALFVWEGVTYYLSPGAVDKLLGAVRSLAPAGSTLCFDYAALSDQALTGGDVKDLRQRMKTQYATEKTRFGIRAGQIETFLAERGYIIVEHLTAAEMTARYLTVDGQSDGQVARLFCLAHAAI